MTEKTIQKAQTDLVQAVLDAHEKRNLERVDMLVTNAIKQLKMSRFKPDQTTCIGLTYLARINTKIFNQSTAIKDVLKSLLRRDNGPANIKGKNDIVLPILAANILLACCDTNEVRGIIIHKIEQWVSSNQKASDMVQHLMATLCMRCQGDQQTVTSLVELRHHWLQYLGDNCEIYTSVPSDLSSSIRNLLHSETSCESLVIYLEFLIKYDLNIDDLAKELSKFILGRPISLDCMLKDEKNGVQLMNIIFKTFVKIFTYLKNMPTEQSVPLKQQAELAVEDKKCDTEIKIPESTIETAVTKIKSEKKTEKDQKPAVDTKKDVKIDVKPPEPDSISQPAPTSTTYQPSKPVSDEPVPGPKLSWKMLYVKIPNHPKVINLGESILEAVLSFLAMVDMDEEDQNDFEELLNCWVLGTKSEKFASIYEDASLTKVYNLSDELRQKLVQSKNDQLIDLGVNGASVPQLVKLLQLCGSLVKAERKMLKKLAVVEDTDAIRSEIKDPGFFSLILDFHWNAGRISEAKELQDRLGIWGLF